MRRFVIVAHTAPVTPDFPLEDLPGAAGRLDVLCRAVGASLFISHGVRRDVETRLVLRDCVRIRIDGATVRRLNPDERSTAALLRRALAALAAGEGEIESTPGLFVSRGTLEQTIDELIDAGASPIVLDEGGLSVDSFRFPSDPAFLLSDHLDFSDREEALLNRFPHVSFGPTPLHTSQAITLAHHVMDSRSDGPPPTAAQDGDLDARLVLAHKVWSEAKAQLIKGLLEDFGLPVNLVMHAPPSVYPMAIDGLAEVRIMVRPRDLKRVREIIADYFEAPCEA